MGDRNKPTQIVSNESPHSIYTSCIGWEHYCYTSRWIMDNFPPNEDIHHFQLLVESEKEYTELCEFYDYSEYDYGYEEEIINDSENIDNVELYEESENNYSSSSDSEYDVDYV